ncbi:MAG: hypothetical protein CMP37_03760 [Rickettsiales bacterium]|nr:hypothetical protein [Rickettsiales bacterium]|tara:strand:+ start:161 stop:352 length:192 start_codon:yes stop_codon:yes gene_type:complete
MNLKIKRRQDHKNYIFDNIYRLRREIINDVLVGTRKEKMPIKMLKHKAGLILKYSRRLKLLHI